MAHHEVLLEARELEEKLLGFVFKERDEEEPFDWNVVNEMLVRRDQLHRALADENNLDAETKAFLQSAYENTQTLLKLAGDVQELTQQELIKIGKGKKAHQTYY